MGAPFTEPTITGYNINPPSDDGTQSSDNEITWAKHKTKIGDPLKTGIEATITNVTAAFGKIIGGAGVTSYGTNTTLQASDQGKLVRATNSGITITTPDATSVDSPFVFGFANGAGDAGIVTLDGSGSQTIDGLASLSVQDGMSFFVFTDGSNWFTAGRGVLNKYDATTAPAGTDDVTAGYAPGSLWIDVTNDAAYICVDATDSAAVWMGPASQAEQEAGTSTTAYVTPAVQQHHVSAAKLWGHVTISGGTPSLDSPSYNINSIGDGGTGIVTVTIEDDFSGAIYSVGGTCDGTGANFVNTKIGTAGGFTARIFNNDGNPSDISFSFWAFGDQ